MATITEVSRLAKVSKASVSRVLSGSRGVKLQTRDAVLKAVKELNYHPNHLAQSLATKVSNCIGLFSCGLNESELGRMLAGIEQALGQYNRSLLFANGAEDEEHFIQKLQILAARSCDSIILLGHDFHPQWLKSARKLKLPPLIGVDAPLNDYAHCIGFDYAAATETLCNYLFSLGHRQIACVIDSTSRGEQILIGYRNAIDNKTLPLNRQLLLPNSCGIDLMGDLINRPLLATALITLNESQAQAVCQAAQHYQVSIPKQLSVVALNCFDETNHSSISGIAVPERSILSALMGIIDDSICCQNHEVAETRLFKGRLLIRDTAIPPQKN